MLKLLGVKVQHMNPGKVIVEVECYDCDETVQVKASISEDGFVCKDGIEREVRYSENWSKEIHDPGLGVEKYCYYNCTECKSG